MLLVNKSLRKPIRIGFIKNKIDDNGNAWETVGATKSKNSIKTRTAVVTFTKATSTKGQKVLENKKNRKNKPDRKEQLKSTKLNKRQPNKKDVDKQNVKNDEQNNRLISFTECSSMTSSRNSSDVTQTTNELSVNNDNANVTRHIPVVKSNKKVYHW